MHLHYENACILNDSPNLNKNPDIRKNNSFAFNYGRNDLGEKGVG